MNSVEERARELGLVSLHASFQGEKLPDTLTCSAPYVFFRPKMLGAPWSSDIDESAAHQILDGFAAARAAQTLIDHLEQKLAYARADLNAARKKAGWL